MEVMVVEVNLNICAIFEGTESTTDGNVRYAVGEI